MNPARTAAVSPRTSAPRAQPLIAARGLCKIYGAADSHPVTALKNLDFEIYDGEFVSVVGQSGCGKSTLLKVLAGLLPYSAGSVELNGKPLRGPSPQAAVVFQSPVLLPWRTVIENLMLPVEVMSLERKAHRARARELLQLVGLEGFENKYPFELSGGMQQRVAISRALIYDPELLLMDEPFGALDAMTRETMNLELLRIWQERRKTVVFVTHSIPEAAFLADQVVVLTPRPGRVADIVQVDLARPRNLDMMQSDEFGRYTRRIRALLGQTSGGGLE